MVLDVFLFLPPPAAAANLREAHPYGPPIKDPSDPNAGEPGFHFDLAFEFAPGAVKDNRVLAVVSGYVRMIADPVVPGLCTLVLMPVHDALRALRQIWRGANIVFIYRNIDVRNIDVPAVQPTLDEPWPRTPLDGYSGGIIQLDLPSVEPPESKQQIQQFLAGEIAVEAEAGQPLLSASGEGGHDGWRRVGFEIAFVPNGAGDNLHWTRLMELVEPSNARTRRLDPISFYHEAMSSGQAVRLAPEHAGHPLLDIASKRVLLEIRDEYDDPAIGIVNITRSGGSTSNQIIGPSAFGTVELDPQGGDYTVSLDHRVLTDLPSGNFAQDSLNRKLSLPHHWAIQSLVMADLDLPENWFVANNPPLRRFWPGNLVVPIRDGFGVFDAYADAIQRLTQKGDFVYLAGWVLMDDFSLGQSNRTFLDLVTEAAVLDATIRVLLWKQVPIIGEPPNKAEAARINALSDKGYDVEAVLDDHTLGLTGSHHQKFLLVYEDGGREIAFCGGVDLNQNRRDTPNHGAIAGYHDVHAKLDGPAVADVHRAFVDRWNSHPNRATVTQTAKNSSSPVGSVYVQVACTYPRIPSQPYPFASKGSFTPLEAFLRAIEKAKKFIYIEDQYLTPFAGDDTTDAADDTLGVLKALREALARIDYLIMVIPNHVALGWLMKIVPHAGQARYRRRRFIRGLVEVAPEKVHVYFLARNNRSPLLDGGEDASSEGDGPGTSGSPDFPNEIYCHSKVWIVDDICMKIGSANCNRRSYTHDGEMDLVMVDGAVSNGARALARHFRRGLWGEHLAIPWPYDAILDDHLIALKYWLPGARSVNARIRDYDYENIENEDSFQATGWKTLIDPDGR